jgi:hypothetical protein
MDHEQQHLSKHVKRILDSMPKATKYLKEIFETKHDKSGS